MHQDQNPNVPQAHALKFRTVVRGRGGPKEAVNDVIDDAEELEDYARDCTGEEDRKRLEAAKPRFEREKVIAVAIGQRPTPAYEIEIVSAVQITGGFVGLQTQIHYVLRTPHPATPPDALTAPAHPHHVVRVKNAGGLVIFRDVTPIAAPPPPPYTTLMVGEEGPPPPPHYTTLMVGEEGPPPPHYTTLMVGEESTARGPADPTTLATGEESGTGPTTMATGEEMAGGRGPFGGF
jgi:hypothetical protein